jgi:tetratricopeptide (TPR) repeat protein
MVGWCYFRLGQSDEAESFYNEALSLDSNLVSSQFDYALVQMSFQRWENAVQEYKRGMGMLKGLGAPCRRGYLHVAATDLRRAIESEPPVRSADVAHKILAKLEACLLDAQSGRATA